MIVSEKVLVFLKKKGLYSLMVTVFMAVTIQFVLAESDNRGSVSGEASYYSQRLIGKRTTSREPYDDKAYTAAHAFHPFGTYLLVTLQKNQQSVVVRVNDRFRPRKGHLVDISMAAAKQIDLVRFGRGQITLRVLDEEEAFTLMTELGQIDRATGTDSVTVSLPVPALRLLPTTPIALPTPSIRLYP